MDSKATRGMVNPILSRKNTNESQKSVGSVAEGDNVPSSSGISRARSSCLDSLRHVLGEEAPRDIDNLANTTYAQKRKLNLIELHEQRKEQKVIEEERETAAKRFVAVSGDANFIDPNLDEILQMEAEASLDDFDSDDEEILKNVEANDADAEEVKDVEVSLPKNEVDAVAAKQKRLQLSRARFWRRMAPFVHRVHIFLLLLRSLQRSVVCDDELLQLRLLSFLPSSVDAPTSMRERLEALVLWFQRRFPVATIDPV